MITSIENIQSYKDITICTFSLDVNYYVKVASESFYSIFANPKGCVFTDLVHTDYRDEFMQVFENIQVGESKRFILPLIDKSDNYIYCDLYLTGKEANNINAPKASVNLFIIGKLEDDYITLRNKIFKYRSLLSIYQDYLFDYDPEVDEFCVYMYLGRKSSLIIKTSLDNVFKYIVNYDYSASGNDTFDISVISKLKEEILQCKESFSCDTILPPFQNIESVSPYHIEGRAVSRKLGSPMVTGVLRATDICISKPAPYYMTTEAFDSATGLLNKKAIIEYTKDLLSLSDIERHYMIVFDVDNFKTINDNYGHLFGDKVIETVAKILVETIGNRGFAGRFGGDEFYIFTSGITNEEDLRNIITAIRKTIKYSFVDDIPGFMPTVSVGISCYPNDGTTYDELFAKADKCLYIAKDRGRDRYIIYDDSKHASISHNIDHAKNIVNPLEEAENRALIISDVYKMLISEKNSPNKIQDSLNYIMSKFEIDGIRIYDSHSYRTPLYSTKGYKGYPNMDGIINDENFQKTTNDNGLLALSSVSSSTAKNKYLADRFLGLNIVSTIYIRVNKDDGSELYFFYDVFNHSIRWNEYDKNYLLALSNIIASFI